MSAKSKSSALWLEIWGPFRWQRELLDTDRVSSAAPHVALPQESNGLVARLRSVTRGKETADAFGSFFAAAVSRKGSLPRLSNLPMPSSNLIAVDGLFSSIPERLLCTQKSLQIFCTFLFIGYESRL
jgi:hypothetical protein